MTDAQLTGSIAAGATALGSVVAFLKWAFGQWMADRKEDREERKKEREAHTAATVQVATAIATMALKFDNFEKRLSELGHAVEEVADEVSGVHRSAPTPVPQLSQRAETAPLGGYRAPRRPRQDTP